MTGSGTTSTEPTTDDVVDQTDEIPIRSISENQERKSDVLCQDVEESDNDIYDCRNDRHDGISDELEESSALKGSNQGCGERGE